MEVSEKSTGKVSAEITVKIGKADYQESVDKALRSYAQKASIPGFRKGKAPKAMIQKMVGKSILIDEINKLVSEKLYNYIKDKNIGVLGEPLPSESQEKIDFDNQEDFEFTFDVAITPEINLSLGKDDKIDFYDITIDDDMVNKQIEAFRNRFGKQEECDKVTDDNDIIKCKFTELNADGSYKEGGIVVESGMISPRHIKNEDEKKKFAGAGKGDKIVFNPAAASGWNDTELAAMLHIKKEEAAEMKSDFEAEVLSVLAFKQAEVDQALFDNAFGKDKVKDEADFKAKIKEMLAGQIAPESDYKFALDARKYIEDKVGNVEFADDMLKRWLKFNDTENKIESVDDEYAKMLPDLKWQLIKEQIVKAGNISIERKDVEEVAKKTTKMQFAQYGMMNVPEDLLQKYADDMLKDSKAARNMSERAIEDKIISYIKDNVTLDKKEISLDDFYKMFENK